MVQLLFLVGGGAGLYFGLKTNLKTVIFNDSTEFYSWVAVETQFWCSDPLESESERAQEKLTAFFLNSSDGSFITRRVGLMNISTGIIDDVYGFGAGKTSGQIKIKYSSKICHIFFVSNITRKNTILVNKDSIVTVENNNGKYKLDCDIVYAGGALLGDVLLENLIFNRYTKESFAFDQSSLPQQLFKTINLSRLQYPNVEIYE